MFVIRLPGNIADLQGDDDRESLEWQSEGMR
jgi:hypothetical protein